MKCTNCGFQNMPGSNDCGRCGTSLKLATAVIDVNPPRAGRFAKKLRRAVPVGRMVNSARQNAATARAADAIGRFSAQTPTWPLLWRMIVPGWSHFYLGQPVRGRLYFWGFLSLLILGILCFGTWGSIFIGLAFSVHSSAIMDIDTQAMPDRPLGQKMLRAMGLSIMLFGLIYLPIGALIRRVAEPHVVAQQIGQFAAGDVVLVHASAAPRVGQVVLYDLPFARIATGPHHILAFGGERIERILAGPGDDVTWENGHLSVNGQPSELAPVARTGLPKKLVGTIPQDRFLILPGDLPNFPTYAERQAWEELSLVPRANVHGRVYARSHPLWRFEVFR